MRELKPEELRWRCDPAVFDFETTAEIQAPAGPIGQERAVSALDFGLAVRNRGYNLFVLGLPGSGRTSMSLAAARRIASQLPAPRDWCYVYNFDDPRRPKAVSLPPGRGRQWAKDMDQFVEDLRREVTRAFESDEYAEQRDELVRQYREQRQRELEQFEKEAREQGFAVGRTPAGFILAPTLGGEVMSPQQFAALPEPQRQEIERKRAELEKKLDEIMRRGHRLEREARRAVQELDRQVVANAVGHLIDELKQRYADVPEVVQHLDAIAQDIAEHADAFRRLAVGEEEPPIPLPPPLQPKPPYERYRVNVVTSNDPEGGAPVVYEDNPTVQNLTGRIEYQAQMGALVTDFTMIYGGALHKANGGILVLDALSVLTRPFAWDALKRCLKTQRIRIESLAERLGLVSTVTLEPEPIPLDVKVVLIGSPWLYYLMWEYDEDFAKLFRVKADFDWANPKTDAMIQHYAAFVAGRCEEHELPPFSREAVARIVEQAVRLAGDKEKLTAQFALLEDLVVEAAHWARQAGKEVVGADDVERAIEQKIWRSNRLEERLMEYIRRGTIIVQTEGTAVGQVNGIAVIPLGDYWIGKPTRITARCYMGRAGVISIDRETKLSGPIHDKGCMILSGFLGQRYALDIPLSCSITLTFEQSYEEIEGDSASSAELYAILSALSGLPLRQDLAVTGSVDQHGNIQPVGGVNRKIEGFYLACKEKGLTGTQGVIIPEANVPHLMLRDEVVQAVREGNFHIYAVKTVDEAIELLTGKPAGELQPDGTYPEGTVNRLVHDRLRQLAEAYRRYAESGGEDEAGAGGADEE